MQLSVRLRFLAPALLATVSAALLGGTRSAQAAAFRSVDERPWRMELEGGALWQSRNQAKVPGEGGTRFSLLDLTGTDAGAFGRWTLEWDRNRRHGFRLVIAPHEVEGSGDLDKPVSFDGVNFAPGRARGTYRFDTYRLTWRYRFHDTEEWSWRAGLTLLLRDAEIAVRQGGLSASKSNTGVVPLLHLQGDWRFEERWSLQGVVDGAYASQGRAVDLSLKLGYDLSDRWRVAAGYRTIEGGSDGNDVLTFAWLHAAVVSVTYGF